MKLPRRQFLHLAAGAAVLPAVRTPLGVTLGKVVGALLIFARALEISARRENLPQTQVGAICAAIVVGRGRRLVAAG
jgi:hypothetical protein